MSHAPNLHVRATGMSLQRFEVSELLTVGETSGQFIYAPEDRFFLVADRLGLEGSPKLTIDFKSGDGENTTMMSFSAAPPSDSQPFVSVEEHWLKTAWHLMRDEGSMKVIEFLLKDEEGGEATRRHYASVAATSCLKRLYTWLSPNVNINAEELCIRYARNSLWSSSVIREISLHTSLPLMAVARQDDVILIQNTHTQQFHRPLKDKYQLVISSMQWAPHSNLLAVGVTGGIVLWYIDPNLRPTSTFLSCFPGQQPLTTISWCPQGRFLACGCPCNPTLLIWDIHLRTSTPLKRFGGGGISHVSWSSDGSRLLVSHMSLFRVWETVHWTCETWTQLASRSNASCWSPKGNILVFSVEGDPSLYYIKFPSDDSTYNSSVSEAAVKCADVSEVCLAGEEDEVIRVGGSVQSLAWDHTGERLAVLFTADSPGANRIAVFRTQCEPVLDLIPGGFVQWMEGETPVWIGFKRDSRNWSILVSAWTDGNIILTQLRNSKVSIEARPSSLTGSTLFSTT